MWSLGVQNYDVKPKNTGKNNSRQSHCHRRHDLQLSFTTKQVLVRVRVREIVWPSSGSFASYLLLEFSTPKSSPLDEREL